MKTFAFGENLHSWISIAKFREEGNRNESFLSFFLRSLVNCNYCCVRIWEKTNIVEIYCWQGTRISKRLIFEVSTIGLLRSLLERSLDYGYKDVLRCRLPARLNDSCTVDPYLGWISWNRVRGGTVKICFISPRRGKFIVLEHNLVE